MNHSLWFTRYESHYVIARPPVAVGFDEKNDRRRKTWKMAVVSITAIWIVDQLLTRFKLALVGFSKIGKIWFTGTNFIGLLDLYVRPERIRKPAFKNITIFCFKRSQNSLKLSCPMHISLKINENKRPGKPQIPSFWATFWSFLELFLRSFPPSSHRFLKKKSSVNYSPCDVVTNRNSHFYV